MKQALHKVDSTAWSGRQWEEWVAERVEERARIFATDPDDMVSARNREAEYTSEYHGRELLELLQNADDASIVGSRSQKAIVVLCEEGLCFANTGTPFSSSGIKSLMISNISPKKNSRARYIGNRGLGFRSVLTWTDCPFILSGNLSVGFDRARAEGWLNELASKCERVRRKVREVAESSRDVPVPTLAVPAILDLDGYAGGSRPSAPAFAKIWSVAQELRSDGYDTVIALPFTSAFAFAEARAQVDQMGREVLLFLRSVVELVVRLPDKETRWAARDLERSVEVQSNDPEETPQVYEIHVRKGTIPREYLKADQEDTSGYEIKLAVPEEEGVGPKVLFNYFPTRVRFPFPLIAHATLELTSNRQNLVESRVNEYLLGELARFMSEIAGSASGDSSPWLPLSLITPRGDLDTVVQQYGFREAVVEAAKSVYIIPVRDGRRLQAAKARRLAVDDASWLPAAGFEDVVITSSDRSLLEMVEDLGTLEMGEDELRDRLNDLAPDTLSITNRATLIVELTKSGIMPNPPPDLLIDANGQRIPADSVTYLPPADGSAFALPHWMSLRILHGELAGELRKAFGGIVAQGLVGQLSEFRLRPYSTANLASAINARVNEIAEEQPESELYFRLDGLRRMLRLYDQSKLSGEQDTPSRLTDARVRVIVPNREGSFVPADNLYLGIEYPRGRLTEYLYGELFPEKMVASPDFLRLDANPGEIEAFLFWLGVDHKPRRKTKQYLHDAEFERYVREQLPYPVRFEDYLLQRPDQLYPLLINDVSWIDGLDKLLERANPHAIVAWLALDGRLGDWQRNGDAQAKLRWLPYNARNYRTMGGQPPPSYVMWLLQRRKWLPVLDGGERAPVDCTLAPNLPEGAKAIFPHPALDESNERLTALKIGHRDVRIALERAGVNTSLDELSWDDFYALLLRLPEIDPEGKHARAVYRVLFARADRDEIPTGSMYRRFLREGKLFAGYKGAADYYSIREGVYYADDAIVPDIVTRELRMLALDRRRGAQKVQRLFGAKPLGYKDIAVEIEDVKEHPREEVLRDEVDDLKPHVYAMRLYSDSQAQRLTRLHNLKVLLCRGASGEVLVGDDAEGVEVSLRDGDIILDDDTAYLCSNSKGSYDLPRLLTDPLIAHDVGEILARVLGVENGGDFTALAQCSPGTRSALLERMLGVDPRSLLDEAEQKLELDPGTIAGDSGFDVVKPLPRPPEPNGSGTREGQDEADPTPPTLGTTEGNGLGEQVYVEETEHKPSEETKGIRGRVRATPSGQRPAAGVRRVTDGKLCQDLAYLFEEAEGQDRYPLRVDYLQGYDYYGCDLLSFDTPEARDGFEAAPDERLVRRFIEVKGRGSEKGPIQLEGNELDSARKNHDRYYLYRVYRKSDGTFEVAILNDPLSSSPKIMYEIDLFRGDRTTTYEVVTMRD